MKKEYLIKLTITSTLLLFVSIMSFTNKNFTAAIPVFIYLTLVDINNLINYIHAFNLYTWLKWKILKINACEKCKGKRKLLLYQSLSPLLTSQCPHCKGTGKNQYLLDLYSKRQKEQARNLAISIMSGEND